MVQSWGQLEKWSKVFECVGHPTRLSLIIMLYGSEVLRGKECLTFGEMLNILGLPKTTRVQNSLNYHLDKLIQIDFVERLPKQEYVGKSKVVTVYHLKKVAHDFLEDFRMTEPIESFLKHYKT